MDINIVYKKVCFLVSLYHLKLYLFCGHPHRYVQNCAVRYEDRLLWHSAQTLLRHKGTNSWQEDTRFNKSQILASTGTDDHSTCK